MTSVADLGGPKLAAGNPGEVRTIARRMSRLASDADQLRSRLTPQALRAEWSGGAADAFAADVTKVPDDLAKVRDSYSMAGAALGRYATALEGAQREIARRASEVDEADRRAHAAATRGSAADGQLRSAQLQSVTLDPLQRAQAERDADRALATRTAARSEQASAEGDRERARSHAKVAKEAFEAEAARCATALDGASAAGIKNDINSWWERNSWVVEAAGEAVWDATKTTGKVLYDIGRDVLMTPANFHEGLTTGDWKAFSESLESVGIVLGALAVVAAVVFTGGSAVPIFLAGAGALTAGMKLGTDLGRAINGDAEVTGETLAWDVLNVATVGVGAVAVRAMKPLAAKGLAKLGANTNAGGVQTRLLRYGDDAYGGGPALANRIAIRAERTGPWWQYRKGPDWEMRHADVIRDQVLFWGSNGKDLADKYGDASDSAPAPDAADATTAVLRPNALTVNGSTAIRHRVSLDGRPFVLQPGY